MYLFVMAILLTSMGVSLLPRIYHQGMADSSKGMLYAEANDFERRFLEDRNARLLQTSEIFSYLNEATIPADLLHHFNVTELENEKLYLEEWATEQTFIVCYFYKKRIAGTGVTLYQFQKIDVSKRPEHAFSTIKNIQWSFALFSLFLVYIFYQSFIRRVAGPTVSLSNWIDAQKKYEPPASLPNGLYADEIGRVGEKLHEALQNAHNFTEREKLFLETASHELRTPITVVQNAAELAERQILLNKGNISDTIFRIKSAAAKMKALTEGLLWLTRDKSEKIPSETFDVAETIENILIENLAMNSRDDWDIEFDSGARHIVIMPKVLFSICVDNLIRNAFQHAVDKRITIEYSATEIKISNGSSDEAQTIAQKEILHLGIRSSRGFGIGLSLVAKIVEAKSWVFDLEICNGIAIARLQFNRSD